MIKNLKKWNWTAYIVIMCVCMIGALGNKNCETISEAFILGMIGGNIFGLLIAFITRN